VEGGRERGQEKGRDGSIWIFIQGPRVSSYATGMEEENGSVVTSAPRHVRKRATLNAGYRVRHVGVPDALPSIQ